MTKITESEINAFANAPVEGIGYQLAGWGVIRNPKKSANKPIGFRASEQKAWLISGKVCVKITEEIV